MTRILFVEPQNGGQGEHVQKTLSFLDYRVVISRETNDITEKLRSIRFDVALLFGIDSEELLNEMVTQVSSQSPDLPILVCGSPYKSFCGVPEFVARSAWDVPEILFRIEEILDRVGEKSNGQDEDNHPSQKFEREQMREKRHASITKKRLSNFFSTHPWEESWK